MVFEMKCVMRKILFLLSFLLIWNYAFSIGELKFRRFDVSNGLPQNSVYSIVEDRQGDI